MTSIANFDIAQHLKVEMFLPYEADNLFLIGLSLIGGDDVLGGNTNAFIIGTSLIGGENVLTDNLLPGFSWQQFEAVTVKVDTELGGSIQSSLYFQPEAGSASIVLQTFDYDPSVNKSVRPGARIRVRLDDGTAEGYLFNGYIDTIDVTYGPQGNNWNTVSIKAFDAHKRIMNTRVSAYDTSGYHGGDYVTPLEAITVAVEAAGFAMSSDSVALNHKLPTVTETDVIVNKFVNDAIETGLGVLWVDPKSEEIVVIPRPSVVTSAPSETYTVGNNHGDAYHLCMSDIRVRADSDVVFNSLRVENKNDAAEYVVKTNQDSIDLYGVFALDVSINTTDTTELSSWADEVFAQSPTKLVSEVSTPAVDRTGTLTNAAFFNPGDLIGVKYTRAPLSIDDYYTITKVSHSIDVDNWTTTLELWKEF